MAELKGTWNENMKTGGNCNMGRQLGMAVKNGIEEADGDAH